VEARFKELLLRDVVRESLRNDQNLSDEFRRAALPLVDGHPEALAADLNEASWEVVKVPNGDPMRYRLALRWAKAACDAKPDNSVYLTTLGVAQYRVGEDAVDVLLKAVAVNDPDQQPVSWAYTFLAMAFHRRGDEGNAKAKLRQAQRLARQSPGDELGRGFLHEVAALIPLDNTTPTGRVGDLVRIEWPKANVILSLAFTRDSANLLVGSDEKPYLRLYNVKTRKEDPPPNVPLRIRVTAPVNDVVLSHDGKSALSASQDGTVIIWSMATRSGQQRLPHRKPVRCVAWSRDGHYVAVGCEDTYVYVYHLTARLPPTMVKHTAAVNSIAFSPDGTRLLAAGDDSQVCLYDLKGKRLMTTYPGGGRCAAFSPDGRWVLAGGDGVRVWATDSAKVLHTFPAKDIEWVCFSPKDEWALATSGDKRLYLWDVKTGELIQAIPEIDKADGHLYRAVFSPDGRYIACGTDRGCVYMWPLRR
jgi:WD40 repeat protein